MKNVCIGDSAGWDIATEKNQIRIGDFTEDKKKGFFIDCLICDNGRVVIKKNVVDLVSKNNMWRN